MLISQSIHLVGGAKQGWGGENKLFFDIKASISVKR